MGTLEYISVHFCKCLSLWAIHSMCIVMSFAQFWCSVSECFLGLCQVCSSASRWRPPSLRWGITGEASSPPHSVPSSSECWRCGTRMRVRLAAVMWNSIKSGSSFVDHHHHPAPPPSLSFYLAPSFFSSSLAFSVSLFLFSPQRQSLLFLRPVSASTSPLTCRSFQHSLSLGMSCVAAPSQ